MSNLFPNLLPEKPELDQMEPDARADFEARHRAMDERDRMIEKGREDSSHNYEGDDDK